MISERISDGIPPQMKILNMVILLQLFLKFKQCLPHKVACHSTICDVIKYVKLFLTVHVYISQDILSQIFDVIESDVAVH